MRINLNENRSYYFMMKILFYTPLNPLFLEGKDEGINSLLTKEG